MLIMLVTSCQYPIHVSHKLNCTLLVKMLQKGFTHFWQVCRESNYPTFSAKIILPPNPQFFCAWKAVNHNFLALCVFAVSYFLFHQLAILISSELCQLETGGETLPGSAIPTLRLRRGARLKKTRKFLHNFFAHLLAMKLCRKNKTRKN